jgi:hypothetical protein
MTGNFVVNNPRFMKQILEAARSVDVVLETDVLVHRNAS